MHLERGVAVKSIRRHGPPVGAVASDPKEVEDGGRDVHRVRPRLIVIRCFPVSLTTAPRLAPRRSYSLRIISSLVSGGATGRDEPDPRLATVCVDDRQDASECIRANGEEPLLAFRIRVFRGQRQWIGKNGLGISESDALTPSLPHSP